MISRHSKAFMAIIVCLVLVSTLALFHPPSRAYMSPITGDFFGEGGVERDYGSDRWRPPYDTQPGRKPPPTEGGVIMSKLGNETAKAELGRATWKLMHTMTLRYPENPTQDHRDALESYFYLTSRLYPCGECAAEFQQLLKKFPPQTSSRRAASLWLCSVHNEVNARLKKPAFDCANLDATYDCGCGDDNATSTSQASATGVADSDPMDLEFDLSKDELTGAGLIKGGR
ncbi:hypothetical protein CONPUDRAFT_125372 [Coniophora puteana RWD-64-598 SS2]|uniref:Sulfhydryl oxidase n=1 Tax=Coniophora puteana (strain RWD-64-598) TaxID=741705 RepID=A0A5M3MN05_CONPW|nr:uncharacterized protein CONPUDRAFT_125372 [Coniophora puteana RWD-64-598 SS2]EIW80569.1 hypothetical protein CONPUDRAFT_125372 [Coniophora puteana RWD-64-598 SS2]